MGSLWDCRDTQARRVLEGERMDYEQGFEYPREKSSACGPNEEVCFTHFLIHKLSVMPKAQACNHASLSPYGRSGNIFLRSRLDSCFFF